jgi:hypothetical protein
LLSGRAAPPSPPANAPAVSFSYKALVINKIFDTPAGVHMKLQALKEAH